VSFKRGRNRRVNRHDPRRVWKRLPHTLKTFDPFYYAAGPGNGGAADGLREYLRQLQEFLDHEFGTDPNAPAAADVMAVGGLSVAGWYAQMLRRAPAVLPPI
jgi:hypothetical protein